MNFGTPPHIKDMFTQPLNTTADNVNTFALTEEERAYVCSIDAQQGAAKEALEAVIEAAQASYEKTIARISLMKDNFLKHLADKHKVKRNKNSSVMPLEGLYVVDATKEQPAAKVDSAASSTAIASSKDTVEKLTQGGFEACKKAIEVCGIEDPDEFADMIRYVFNRGILPAPLRTKLEGPTIDLLNSICDCTKQLDKEGSPIDELVDLLKSSSISKDNLHKQLLKVFLPGQDACSSQQAAMLMMMGMIHYLFLRFVNP